MGQFSVELVNDEGRFVRGSVRNRINKEQLLVDVGDGLEPILVSEDDLYFPRKPEPRRDVYNEEGNLVGWVNSTNDYVPGERVEVLYKASKTDPFTWYSGTITFRAVDRCKRYWEDDEVSRYKKDWALVDIELSRSSRVETTVFSEFIWRVNQENSTHRVKVTPENFFKYHLTVPPQIQEMVQQLDDPSEFDVFLRKRAGRLLEANPENAIFLLARQSDIARLVRSTDPEFGRSIWGDFETEIQIKGYGKIVDEMRLEEVMPVKRKSEIFFRIQRPVAASFAEDTATADPVADCTAEPPDEILASVFRLLDLRQRTIVGGVCRQWATIMKSSVVTQKLIFPALELDKLARTTTIIRHANKFLSSHCMVVVLRGQCYPEAGDDRAGRAFPLDDLVQLIEFRGIVLQAVVLASGYVELPPILVNGVKDLALARVTKELVLQDAGIVDFDPYENGYGDARHYGLYALNEILYFPGQPNVSEIIWQFTEGIYGECKKPLAELYKKIILAEIAGDLPDREPVPKFVHIPNPPVNVHYIPSFDLGESPCHKIVEVLKRYEPSMSQCTWKTDFTQVNCSDFKIWTLMCVEDILSPSYRFNAADFDDEE